MSHLHSEDELGSNMHKKDFQTTSIIPLCEESINRAMMEFKTSFMNRMTDEYISQIIGTKDAYKESIKTLTDCVLQNKCIEEKQEELLEQVAKLKRNKEQNVEQVKIIQSLKEEFNGKRAHIFANKRAIKDRLKELEKSAALFTERLGLEIRKLHGEKLQFVFRYINPKAPHQPYTFILCINEGGQYEVLSCDPPLECISELQQKVQETNNFSAFLANFRKAFTVLACNEKEI
ncbi:kinetochore protein Spc25 isoform X2 [Microcaecilia unicolor]|uniref:Kinetochore protein SPC25 n=1 Tax=Microcaecilia unicolor TaxID=1415580 RepID=A0A6P7Z5Q5_9AMPH|nr:kinetochore protein Spc25 isoform X2 [Microcaecilia unicolor]